MADGEFGMDTEFDGQNVPVMCPRHRNSKPRRLMMGLIDFQPDRQNTADSAGNSPIERTRNVPLGSGSPHRAEFCIWRCPDRNGLGEMPVLQFATSNSI